MCGICGFVGAGVGDPETLLRRMSDTMAARGPDDAGIWTEGAAGLGHRRLSIIDLSPLGHQPMCNEDGGVWTVLNGEIYNYRELRGELEERGHVFRGQSDTEVIPHAWEEWGEEFPLRLRGMFAIALWDRNRERLLLVRDRLGKKPLFWHRSGGLLLFGSTLAPLAAWPGFPREIDRKSLYRYLSFGYVPAPASIFRDTFKLPAGHLLVSDRGGLSVRRWWDPVEEAARSREGVGGEAGPERLEELLLEAVRYRLISDVPLGAFLSGGIDSSLVVALMTRLASGPVRTFTIGFWEREYDEAKWAKAVAARLGTDHTELYLEPKDALEAIPALPAIYDEPFGDPSAIPTFLVSRLARRSVTVVLSGDGGDELFAGYPRYRWFRRGAPLLSLPAAARRLLAPLAARLPHPKARKAASWLDVRDGLELYFGMVGLFRRGALAGMMGFELPLEGLDFKRAWDAARGRPVLERLMLTDLASYLPEDILMKVDRASMACSLEARTPLLDHRVVELALAMPPGLKYRRGTGKLPLRRILGRYLPRELYERPKMGFSVPLDHWFRGELKQLLRDYTAPDRLRREGFLDPAPVQELVGEHLSGSANHQYLLWTLLMFQMWLEKWG